MPTARCGTARLTTSAGRADQDWSQTDSTGDGRFDRIQSDITVVAADGSRIETVRISTPNGSLRDSSVTTTSADGRSKTTQSDLDGNGTIDLSTVATIVVACRRQLGDDPDRPQRRWLAARPDASPR